MSDHRFQRFSDRFFRVSPLLTRPGWYAKLREGEVVGPFSSREAAHDALCELFGLSVEACDELKFPGKYAPDCRGS